MSNLHNKRRQAAAAMVVQSGASSFFSSWTGKSKVAEQQATPADLSLPIRDPNPNDVLCGRGGLINGSRGNVQFREVVAQYKTKYNSKSTKRTDKAKIAAQIVQQIRAMNPPGRFLKECPNGMWYDVGDAKAIRKAGQALRESAPAIREELEKSGADIENQDSNSTGSNESKNDGNEDNQVAKPKPASNVAKEVKKKRRSSKASVLNNKGRQVTASPDVTQSMPLEATTITTPPRHAGGALSSESSTPPPSARSGRSPASCVSRRGGKRIRTPVPIYDDHVAPAPTFEDPIVEAPEDDPPMPPLTVQHNRVKLPPQYPPPPGFIPQQYAAVGFSFPPTRSSIHSAQTRALLQQSAAENPHLAPYSPIQPVVPGPHGIAVRRSSDLAFGKEFFPTAENNSNVMGSEGSFISDVTCSALASSITAGAGEHKQHPAAGSPRVGSHEHHYHHYHHHHDVLALHRSNTAPSVDGTTEDNVLYDPLIARTNSLPQFHASISEVAARPKEETSDMTASSGSFGKEMAPPPNVSTTEDGDKKPAPRALFGRSTGPQHALQTLKHPAVGLNTRTTRSDTTSGSAMDLDESLHSNCGTSDSMTAFSDTLMALHLEDDMTSSLLS